MPESKTLYGLYSSIDDDFTDPYFYDYEHMVISNPGLDAEVLKKIFDRNTPDSYFLDNLSILQEYYNIGTYEFEDDGVYYEYGDPVIRTGYINDTLLVCRCCNFKMSDKLIESLFNEINILVWVTQQKLSIQQLEKFYKEDDNAISVDYYIPLVNEKISIHQNLSIELLKRVGKTNYIRVIKQNKEMIWNEKKKDFINNIMKRKDPICDWKNTVGKTIMMKTKDELPCILKKKKYNDFKIIFQK